MDICGVIATRKDSKRIKYKSVRKFGTSNLSVIKIDQALKIKKFKNIYFSSDIPELNKYASKKGLILIKRPKKYLGKCTISDLAPYLAKFIKESHICYLMNTSPLLKTSTFSYNILCLLNIIKPLFYPNIGKELYIFVLYLKPISINFYTKYLIEFLPFFIPNIFNINASCNKTTS